MYDPYQHAEELGLTVLHRPIRTAHELWLPDHNTIVIRSGLRAVHDRSALAHGVAHAEYGHQSSGPKEETQADRLAASRLIDLGQCLEVMKWAPDCHRLARELGVSTRLARVFLNVNRLAG